MEILSVNFIHSFRPNEEQQRKMVKGLANTPNLHLQNFSILALIE